MAIVVSGTQPTPQTRQFADLKSEVSRYVQAPDDNEAQRVSGDGLNEAIRLLNMETWWFTLTYQDITTVAGTDSYTINADYKDSRALIKLDSSGNRDGILTKRDAKSFEIEFDNATSNGTPSAYTVFNVHDALEIQLNVPPDASFVSSYPTLRHRYYKNISLFVGDSDVADVPSEVELFLLWQGRAYMSAVYDYSKTQYAEQKAHVMWMNLRTRNMEYGNTDWSE